MYYCILLSIYQLLKYVLTNKRYMYNAKTILVSCFCLLSFNADEIYVKIQ